MDCEKCKIHDLEFTKIHASYESDHRKLMALCQDKRKMQTDIDRLKEASIHAAHTKEGVDRIELALKDFVTKDRIAVTELAVKTMVLLIGFTLFGALLAKFLGIQT